MKAREDGAPRLEPDWPLALERAAASRTTLILGDTDSGKTSLATYLARGLAARGFSVGVVDADLGQSQIGPPTTLGLGRVGRPLCTLGEAELLALAWVGSTSPPGFEPQLWAGTRRLVDRGGALGLRPIVIDTCGLVRGSLGLAVKLGKIRQVEPDLVVCLRRGDECAPILAGLAAQPATGLLTLPVGAAARRRSPEERRRHREQALEAYFSGAGVREVALGRLVSGSPRARGAPADGALEGALVGLLDAREDTLGVGRIVSVDRARARLLIETPAQDGTIAHAVLGSGRFHPAAATR